MAWQAATGSLGTIGPDWQRRTRPLPAGASNNGRHYRTIGRHWSTPDMIVERGAMDAWAHPRWPSGGVPGLMCLNMQRSLGRCQGGPGPGADGSLVRGGGLGRSGRQPPADLAGLRRCPRVPSWDARYGLL